MNEIGTYENGSMPGRLVCEACSSEFPAADTTQHEATTTHRRMVRAFSFENEAASIVNRVERHVRNDDGDLAVLLVAKALADARKPAPEMIAALEACVRFLYVIPSHDEPPGLLAQVNAALDAAREAT